MAEVTADETRNSIQNHSRHDPGFENGAAVGAGGVGGAVDRVCEPHPQNRIALSMAGQAGAERGGVDGDEDHAGARGGVGEAHHGRASLRHSGVYGFESRWWREEISGVVV